MKTVVIENILPILEKHGKLEKNHPLFDAANAIKRGELVAIPTETVYGLGANALDSNAVDKIFEVKGRPNDNPLIVHISSPDKINELVAEITPLARMLMDSFMPGPITLVMKKSNIIPAQVTAGLDTVAVRVPSHPIAKYFLEITNLPIAAPSANISGRPSPTSIKHVINDLNGKISFIIDGGYCDVGVESTVVDVTGEIPIVLRPGYITNQNIIDVCGCVKGSGIDEKIIRSPGMKYKHYAPNARVYVPEIPSYQDMIEDMMDFIKENLSQKKKIVVYSSQELKTILSAKFPSLKYITFGKRIEVKSALSLLFYALRKADEVKADIIIVEPLFNDELAQTYMNRLKKACGII